MGVITTPDWTIVGAGLYGATLARGLVERDPDVRVRCLEATTRIGGHAASERRAGIEMHLFGPHIFHTDDAAIWNWANRFSRFSHFQFKAKAYNRARHWSFPINLATGREVFGVDTPREFWLVVEAEATPHRVERPANLEQHALGAVGPTLYELLFAGYTKKAWGREPRDLPASIIKRIPIRWTEDDRYFKSDRYEGIPRDGYTRWIESILDHPRIEVQTGVDVAPQDVLAHQNRRFVWTGPIDALFEHRLGRLPYRSRRFVHETVPDGLVLPTPCVNVCDAEDPRLRLIEHKHFSLHEHPTPEQMMGTPSVVSVEYGTETGAPYYPIRIEENVDLYRRYVLMARDEAPHVHLGGRLGTYRYMNMDQIIASAQKDLATLVGPPTRAPQ